MYGVRGSFSTTKSRHIRTSAFATGSLHADSFTPRHWMIDVRSPSCELQCGFVSMFHAFECGLVRDDEGDRTLAIHTVARKCRRTDRRPETSMGERSYADHIVF